MKPNGRDQVEILLIFGVVVILIPFTLLLPRQLPLGEVVLYSAALLLLQGLVRDLAVKAFPPKTCRIVLVPGAENEKQGSVKTCMCAESTIGIVGIFSGVLLLFSGGKMLLHFPWFVWPLWASLVFILGFFLKSVVIDWKNRRLMLVKDHRTISS